jgi:hypothetical protein
VQHTTRSVDSCGKVSFKWIVISLPFLLNGPAAERTLCRPPVISSQVCPSYRDLMQMAHTGHRCDTCWVISRMFCCTFIPYHFLLSVYVSVRTYFCQCVPLQPPATLTRVQSSAPRT